VVGVNVTINALLVVLLIWMTKKTIPVLTTVQFKVQGYLAYKKPLTP